MANKRKKRNDGRYAIRRKVDPYKDKNGKVQIYKTFYGNTVKEAEQNYQEYTAGADRTPVFFDDLIESFISDTFIPDSKYKPGTKQRYIDAYRHNLEPQKSFIHMPVKDITYMDIQKAYNAMTCKPSGVENCHKLLRLFFALLIRHKIIEVDPTVGIVIPTIEKKTDPGEIITFTDSEIDAIKSYINRSDLPTYEQKRVDRLRFLILLLIHTGARISELLALTYDDITKDGITINKQVIYKPIFKDGKTDSHILDIDDTKTDNSIRVIPISESLYNAFLDHKKEHQKEQMKLKYRTNQVFTTKTGKLYDKHSLRHTFDKIHAAAGVPGYGLHTYRRTFGTRLARDGVKIQTLCKLMGHSDISITAKYYIGIPDDEKKAAIELLG